MAEDTLARASSPKTETKRGVDARYKQMNEALVQNVVERISALENDIVDLRLEGSSTVESRHKLRSAMDTLSILWEELEDVKFKEHTRFGASVDLESVGLVIPEVPRRGVFRTEPSSTEVNGKSIATTAALIKWNTILLVWLTSRNWRKKAVHTRMIGDAEKLLSALETSTAQQYQIHELRSHLYSMRLKTNLDERDLFLKKRLEEQLRDVEEELKSTLTREVPQGLYTEEEQKLLYKLEKGTTLLKYQKKGRPHDRLFTFDPYSGYILWGKDKDATTIHSATLLGISTGISAQLSSKYVPTPQTVYSIRLETTRIPEKFIYVVAYNQEQFELWTKGSALVLERLQKSQNC